jgi:predicted TPR repeat methyltransferase
VSHYDAVASEYDGHFTRPVDEWEDEFLAALLRPFTVGRSVLDLGCGTGWVADHCDPGAYTGVDASGPMLEELARKHPSASTVKASIGEHGWSRGLAGDSFDAITATWSLEYLGELPELLTICTWLAAPGGVIALHGSLPRGHRRAHFSVKAAPYRPLGPHQVRETCRELGIGRPVCTGTSALPDTWTRLGRRAWDAALRLPAGMHYSAMWAWQL